MFLVHVIPVYCLVAYGPRWLPSTGLLPALLGAVLILFASVVLAAALFLVAEKPYFNAQRRKHAAPPHPAAATAPDPTAAGR